jgi:hypothetical protein
MNWVPHWLSPNRKRFNGHDLRGSKASVEAAVQDALRMVDEKDLAEPGRYVKVAEARHTKIEGQP